MKYKHEIQVFIQWIRLGLVMDLLCMAKFLILMSPSGEDLRPTSDQRFGGGETAIASADSLVEHKQVCTQ